MDKDLQRCIDLLKENDDDLRKSAENVLLSICQNILYRPNDKQYRKVRLDDDVVIEKLLPTVGAMECLFDVGFIEAADCLVLPKETSLLKLKALHNSVAKSLGMTTYVANNIDNYNLMPKCSTPEEKRFFTSILGNFHYVLQYEDPALQEKARKLIPITELEIATMSRIREIQKRIKLREANLDKHVKERLSESDIDTKDLFIMELMHWFKYKFFTWMDNPKCSACFGDSEHYQDVASEDPKCSRIEIHRCTNCQALIKFPRYTDPEPLLTLRRGRCGEWTNVFTLFCRALGYDARLVHDVTDHIWTEVWSMQEKRWIHVDPCEDVMDRPLMYEKGWKKKLVYIIAFSKDEVQDVTWRYTCDQLSVMQRRNICSESILLQFIESLNKHRQCSRDYSAFRREYVIKRRLSELVETIRMPEEQNSNDKSNETYEERSSGSLAWRLARGEVTEPSPETSYTWDISTYGETFHMYYSIIKDVYKVTDIDGKVQLELCGWQSGVNSMKGGIFRKVENDWKMVYLARSPGEISGQLKWNFEVKDPNLCVSTFSLQAWVRVFYGAKVTWQIEAFFNDTDPSKPLVFPIKNCGNYRTDYLKGSIKLVLTATVFGSQGDSAWQHSQLFRQSLGSEEDRSLIINIQLKKR
ncbi:N-glycanase Pngl [Calliopsis andreniformis]|uniref:N-glycanase Pngl n=1 Tax=Calliopsis andreniformis TaxID=337506 RepID=UPI003FCD08A2